MGGKPCIRGMRVTVESIIGLIASNYTTDEILDLYPYLEQEDINSARAYATWRLEDSASPPIST